MKAVPPWLSRLVAWASSLSLLNRCKAWLPQPLRQHLWQLAVSREVFTVWGSRLHVPPSARNRSVVMDQYEPEVARKLIEILQPGMTVCDIGANIGFLTLLAARLVGPAGRVYAFEPVPDNFRILQQNIARNGHKNVTTFQKAVSEHNGVARIHISDFCGCHSLLPNPAQDSGRTIEVEMVRLDSLPDLRHVDLIKIDTEGTELSVLRSFGSTRPTHILLECNSWRLTESGMTGRQFLEELRSLGFLHLENLEEPAAGLQKIEDGYEGSWNLYASAIPAPT
jgi:FkbM family methyltransferase